MNLATIQRAAEFSVQSYKSDDKPDVQPEDQFKLEAGWKVKARRVVNLYQDAVSNEVKALVIEPEQGQQQVFVVFRGTEMKLIGNWLFANLQLFKLKYFGCPVQGTVHMGFYRGFHWLWHGGGEPRPSRLHNIGRLCLFGVRHLIIVSWLLMLGWLALQGGLSLNLPWLGYLAVVPIMLLLAAWLFLIAWETGALEGSFRAPEVTEKGGPLASLLDDLRNFEEVIFTGHSLGGAMATLAFAEFQKQSGGRKGRLVTFGAPRLGDKVCIEKFEKDHVGAYLHVINCGDPVPEVPGTLRDAKSLTGKGEIEGILKWVGRLRVIWALIYWQKSPGKWKEPPAPGEWNVGDSIMKVGASPLAFENHPMVTYKALVEAVLEKRARA